MREILTTSPVRDANKLGGKESCRYENKIIKIGLSADQAMGAAGTFQPAIFNNVLLNDFTESPLAENGLKVISDRYRFARIEMCANLMKSGLEAMSVNLSKNGTAVYEDNKAGSGNIFISAGITLPVSKDDVFTLNVLFSGAANPDLRTGSTWLQAVLFN